MSAIQMQKKALRSSVRALLASIPASSINVQSQAITSHVLALNIFKSCKSASCYLSMPAAEVDTSGLVSEVIKRSMCLFVPRIRKSKDGHMDILQIYSEEDLSSLPSGVWGIREPGDEYAGRVRMNATSEDAPPLNIVFMPGLAFDESYSRLGHGRGYYDRFLNAYWSLCDQRKWPKPYLIALALREQILAPGQIPTDSHDYRPDMIITPDGILPPKSGPGSSGTEPVPL